MDIDYEQVLREAIKRYGEINSQIEELELEQTKLLQFAHATVNMLPEVRQKEFTDHIQAAAANFRTRNESLTDAVRRVLETETGKWMTVAEVRDRLIAIGFDFSKYVSNPLASVSTTLKRISDKDPYLKADTLEGVTIYSWAGQKSHAAETVAIGAKPTKTLSELINLRKEVP